MHGFRYRPAPFRQEPEWDDEVVTWCRNIPPGKCCNNLIFYAQVDFENLAPHDMAAVFHRDVFSYGITVDMRNRKPYEPTTKAYGCGGRVMGAGLPNANGYFGYRGSPASRPLSGAMWLNCAQDPKGALRKAFRPRLPDQTRSTLTSMLDMAAHVCNFFKKRATYGHGDNAASVKAGIVASVNAGLPPVNGTSAGNGAGQLDSGQAANDANGLDLGGNNPIADGTTYDQSDLGWVFPDLITFNGTNYTESAPGNLNYYDDQGNLLNVTMFVPANQTTFK